MAFPKRVIYVILDDKNNSIDNGIENVLGKKADDVRAIYMTAYTAGYAKRRNSLIEKVVASDEYNAIVIDLKDVSGFLAYTPDKRIEDSSPSKKIKDIHAVVKQIKERRSRRG